MANLIFGAHPQILNPGGPVRAVILLPLLLAGCVPAFAGRPAGPDALPCATSLLGNLGYSRIGDAAEGNLGSFTARKPLPSRGIYAEVGEISVTVSGDDSRRTRMSVSAARYEIRDGTVIPGNVPTAIPGRFPGVLQPAAAPGRSRVRGERRLSAGPVAADAELVRQQCGRSHGSTRVEVASSVS